MESVKIRKYISPVPEDICQGVLAIVADNVTSLSMMHPLSSHPRFEAYRTALNLEIHNYLAMDEPFRLEVVTASLWITVQWLLIRMRNILHRCI